MNAENLTKLADFLDSLPETPAEGDPGFHMRDWYMTSVDMKVNPYITQEMPKHYMCGTVACIGGWAEVLEAKERGLDPDLHVYHTSLSAENWLGFPTSEDEEDCPLGDILFCPDDWYNDAGEDIMECLTAKQAAIVIRNLIVTGEVDWSLVGYQYRGEKED